MVYYFVFDNVDIKEYIASGILESVALGLASEQEQQEVRCLAKIYPELQEEFLLVQRKVETFFLEHAESPDSDSKSGIMAAIRSTKQIPKEELEVSKPEARVVSMAQRQSNPWKMVAAASIVLLLGLGALLFVNRSEMNDLNGKMVAMEQNKTKNEQMMDALTIEQVHLREVQEVLADEATHTVMMSGTAMEPTAKVKIMWSKNMQKAVMHAEKIAPPPVNMQYQLWAIVEGKPISVGVFTYDEVEQMTEPFDVGMSNISTFAITLEKMGGSPTPTLDKMVVAGNVNS